MDETTTRNPAEEPADTEALDTTEEIEPEEELDPVDELESAAQALADYFYQRTAASKVTDKKSLILTPPSGVSAEFLAVLLPALGTCESHPLLADVTAITGKKDIYYYTKTIMTPQYAQLDALLEDKDILATIASVARSDSRLYPRPTQFSKLRGMPFKFTMDELLGAAARMKDEPDYEDIGTISASNGERAFFSSRFISRSYAESLLEWIEVGEKENP